MGRNFLKLVLALVIFAVVSLPSTRSGHSTSGGHVATGFVDAPVYASSDCASASWEQGDGTAGLTIYTLASHAESPKVYAGLWFPKEGVYVADSGENSWDLPTFPITSTRVTALAVDPTNPAVVYAGTEGSGIKRSADSGDSWEATTGLEGQDVWSLAVAPTAGPIYAYAGAGDGIYVSIDGTDWDLAGGPDIDMDKFYALVVDPQNNRTVYVGTKEEGVYQTTDGGISWKLRGLDEKTVRALALHPDDSDIIYAGTQPHGIFKSTDGGASWSLSGLGGRDGVFAIAINPRDPDFVYAGTYGDGVWVSYNGGSSWHGMPGLIGGVYSLTLFSPESEDEGQVLYVGTTDGVWARAVYAYITYLPLVYKE